MNQGKVRFRYMGNVIRYGEFLSRKLHRIYKQSQMSQEEQRHRLQKLLELTSRVFENSPFD